VRAIISDLTLLQSFIKTCRKANVLSDAELRSVFSNLSELAVQHNSFLNVLQERISSWSDKTVVADIFLEKFQFVSAYKPYVINYNSSFAAVYYLTKKYREFAKLIEVPFLTICTLIMLQEFEQEQLKSSALSLESFLIMPVQRYVSMLPHYF
jgi:hypothetical protein